jgi:hypothetical protein
VRPSSKGDF